MGAWGSEPWDNDGAADWFGSLFEGSPFVERVHAGLQSDDGEQVVAALWVVTVLARVYVWPMADLDETLDLAIAAADQLLAKQDPGQYLADAERDLVKSKVEVMRAQIGARKG
jgi:hypothetical protein